MTVIVKQSSGATSGTTLIVGFLMALTMCACTSVLDSSKPDAAACFMRVTGGALNDEAVCVRQTSDGGYVVLGTSASYGAGGNDLYLVKLDAHGVVQWDSAYGGARDEIAQSVELTADGGYVLVGSTLSFPGSYNVYVVKVDAAGHKQWEQNYGGPTEDYGRCLVISPNGEFTIAGTTRNPDYQSLDFYLIHTDASGNKLWDKSLAVTGGNYDENCYGIARTAAGGYMLVGNIQFGAATPRIATVTTDSAGKSLLAKSWLNTYGVARSVVETAPGQYILFGYTQDIGATYSQASTTNVNAKGEFSAGGAYGTRGLSEFNSGVRTADGGSIGVGYTTSTGNGGSDILLVKSDANGHQQWARTFGGADEDVGTFVQQTADGGYILVGKTKSFGPERTGFDEIIIKVDANGALCN
jgi:hypothetical protein